MRALTLVRHAKSSWEDPGLADIDRPLDKRGRRDAPASARRFAAACSVPDRIVSSPAVRTRETASEFARALGIEESSIVQDPRIYAGSHARLFTVLRELPASVTDVMLVGHSPGIADLAHALCGEPQGKFPTCAIVRMRLPERPWEELVEGDGEFLFFDTPKRPALPDP